jgi:hypothetical protein
MKVSDKGAEYEVSAVPFNHLGFSDVVATTPFKLEVTAKNLTEFFSLGTDSATSVNSEPSMITDATHRQEALDDNARSTAATFTGGQDLRKENELKREALMKSGIRVKSYTGAMNTWLTDVKAQAQADFADTILFEIVDPEIKDKQNFVSKDKIGIPNRQMGDKTNPQSGIRTMMGDDNHPTTLVTINQGSSVIDTITLAMLGTEYIQEQLIDPDDSTITDSDIEAKLKKPLKWFKIIPTVLLGEYDEKRKTYAKTFIYKIIKFEHYDTKSIYAPKGAPPGYVKDYSYIFTGNNKDILNLDLSFDTLFYVAMNLKPGNQPKVTGQKSAEFDKNQITTREKIAKANAKLIQNVDEFSHKTVYTSGSGMVSNQDVKSLTARELQRNLLNTALGDMISLKLKIVGDPDFIKQDDFFFPSDSSPYLNRLRTQNLSILTDASSIYANVTFNTAEDYSEDGLAIPGGTGKYSSGTFSGIYQIIQVKNTFDGGKFEQELDLIRYENQLTVDDQNAATSSVNEERIDTNSPEMAAIMDCRPDVTGPPIPAGLTPPTVAIPKTAAEMATLVPSGSKSITSGSLLEKLPTMSAIPKLPVIPPGTPSIGPLPAGAQYGTPLSETEYRRILGGSN